MKKKYSLWMRLSILFILILVILVSLFYGIFLSQNAKIMQRNEQDLLRSTATPLSYDDLIISSLTENKTDTRLQERMTQLTNSYNFDFIVVLNMEGNRLTHPDPNEIGKHFKGGDEVKALEGKAFYSTSEGTLGTSLRYFTPVYSTKNGHQIGAIVIGIKQTRLSELVEKSRKKYSASLIFSALIGLLMAALVAYYLKRQLHDLEPGEAYRLIEERNAMLEETKDAVFFINLSGKILLSNRAAAAMVNDSHEQFNPQQSLFDFFPTLKESNFERKVSRNFRFNNKDYIISSAPVNVNRKKIGYILFFRNATDTIFVLDQLANTTAYATSLQTQTHEFMNKLHVIYGLVDLEAYEELRLYLESILQPDTAFLNQLTLLIKDPILASFFIGEREKFSERKSKLMIDIQSEIALILPDETRGILINLLRFINLHLLQSTLPEIVDLTLESKENDLTVTYRLPISFMPKTSVDYLFNDYYFKQLLIDLPGKFEVIEKDAYLYFHLIYEGKDGQH